MFHPVCQNVLSLYEKMGTSISSVLDALKMYHR